MKEYFNIWKKIKLASHTDQFETMWNGIFAIVDVEIEDADPSTGYPEQFYFKIRDENKKLIQDYFTDEEEDKLYNAYQWSLRH